MLFVCDIVDLISQGRTAQKVCVVCSSRGQDFARFIDDGFDVSSAHSPVLCLDMENHPFVFDIGVISGHCFLSYSMGIVNSKTPDGNGFSLSVLSCLSDKKNIHPILSGEEGHFCAFLPKVEEAEALQASQIPQADYY